MLQKEGAQSDLILLVFKLANAYEAAVLLARYLIQIALRRNRDLRILKHKDNVLQLSLELLARFERQQNIAAFNVSGVNALVMGSHFDNQVVIYLGWYLDVAAFQV